MESWFWFSNSSQPPLWWPMQSRSTTPDNLSTVHDLLLHTNMSYRPWKWNVTLINQLYTSDHAKEILATPISFRFPEDKVVWSGNSSGTYTAKDGFRLSHNHHILTSESFWKFLWSLSIPPKFQLFLWKLLHEALPSGDILSKHHLSNSLACLNGCDSKETLEHVFFGCPKSRALWWCTVSIRPEWENFSSFCEWVKRALKSLSHDNLSQIIREIIFLLHRIWTSRNLSLHQGKSNPVLTDMRYIHHLSNFHVLIAGSEDTTHRFAAQQEQLHLHSGSSKDNGESSTPHQGKINWQIIFAKLHNNRPKAIICTILFNEEVFIKLRFKEEYLITTPFLPRCL